MIRSTLARVGHVLALLVAAATFGLIPGVGKASQMGDGPMVPGIIQEMIQQVPQQMDCSPGRYSKRLERCVYPEPEHEPVQVDCEPPGRYSQRLGRCIYPQHEEEPVRVTCDPPYQYSRRTGDCYLPEPKQPKQVSCKFPLVRDGKSCVCSAGYNSLKGKCVQQKKEPPQETADVSRIQECLAQLGYEPGPADGNPGKGTRDAYRSFQQANALGKRPLSFTDGPTKTKLFQMCEAPPKVEVAEKPSSRRCLPRDLYDTLKAAYGERAGVEQCVDACLPKPTFYSEEKLASVAEHYGVDWCESCIRLGSWLPLDAIRQIESAANVTLCASPPQLCYLPGRPIVYSTTEIRTIYRGLPASVGNESDIAVVIGNEPYQGDLPAHVYGHADADAIDQLLTDQLGYRKENIIDLRDATLSDLERVFGTEENPGGELAERVGKDKPGDVFIYISSHGMAKEDGGASYILPVDGKADDLDKTAYPLQQLYKGIGKAAARTTMLMLEATFAKTVSDLVDPPNIPELEVVAMPETPVPGLAVFTAADRDQHSLGDPEYGIGLFTRYVIAGLAGEADVAPLGNGDSQIDSVELFVYTSDMVRTAARKSFGLEQKPILSKIDNLVVGKLAGISRPDPAIRAALAPGASPVD